MKKYSVESSRAFVNTIILKPYQLGLLDGLTFAIKDLIDIKGDITGCGNPTWAATHPKAVENAVCVEQLLLQGASCKGKTITDELAFSLIGENHFYGTPVNPKAPDHVPGGSSSGSASAVACGLVDFALGTDTGGSVRVPASNCGIFGFRPSHGRISLAGVMPFAPTFDTVGILATSPEILSKVVLTLTGKKHDRVHQIKNIYLLDDVLDICDRNIQETMRLIVKKINYKQTTLSDIIGKTVDYQLLLNTYTLLQHSEVWSSLGSWICESRPSFGPVTQANFYNLAAKADRKAIQSCIEYREYFADQFNAFLNQGNLICFPTTPMLAPKLSPIGKFCDQGTSGDYYPRTLGIDAISGLSRAPQITLPVGESLGIPIGLSFMAAYHQDHTLCAETRHILAKLTR